MRISDWSSDVCSSDLRERVCLAVDPRARIHADDDLRARKAVRGKIVDAVGIERVALLDPRRRPTLAAGEADELDLGWPAEAAGTLLCGRRAIGPLIGLGTGGAVECARTGCRRRRPALIGLPAQLFVFRLISRSEEHTSE